MQDTIETAGAGGANGATTLARDDDAYTLEPSRVAHEFAAAYLDPSGEGLRSVCDAIEELGNRDEWTPPHVLEQFGLLHLLDCARIVDVSPRRLLVAIANGLPADHDWRVRLDEYERAAERELTAAGGS